MPFNMQLGLLYYVLTVKAVQNKETRLDAFEMKELRKILRVSRTQMSRFLTKLE